MPTLRKSRQSIPRLLSGHAANERSEASSYLGHLFGAAADELWMAPVLAITTRKPLTDGSSARIAIAGRPFDDLDVALVDTLERFPLALSDMIAGQQMDLYRSRYERLRLNLCYRRCRDCDVAVMGVDSSHNTAAWNHNQGLVVQPKRRSTNYQPTHQYPARCGEDALRGVFPYKT